MIVRRWLLILMLFAGSARSVALAEDTRPVKLAAWEHVPVLSNGRVIPMDSFARQTLLAFSGKSTFDRKPASLWLARVLFTPDQVRDDKIFLINHPEVAEALGIAAEGRSRYSYSQLEPALPELSRLVRAAFHLEADARSPVENEMMRLYNNLGLFSRLLQSFTFARVIEDFDIKSVELRKEIGIPEDLKPAYIDLFLLKNRIDELVTARRADRGGTPKSFDEELFALSMTMRVYQRQAADLPPAMIPVLSRNGQQWSGAWEAMNATGDRDATMTELKAIRDMATAFRLGDRDGFDKAGNAYNESIIRRVADPGQLDHINAEVFYNKSDSFYRSELLYGFAFILALMSVPFRGKWTYRAAFLLLLIALIPHTYGIIARMVIMDRPPVTNLYSTFVFVSWTCALIGLAVEYFQKNRLGLITGSSMGLALLMTAARFGTEGDTMGVMVAVLDSNFWLATHVVTISIGYAGCCASALLGHIYLLQAIRRQPDDPALKETDRAVYGAQAFGLIFTYLGTMLGGVWADQSWGRFWGWDPKENGALVIVLWSAILFHARVGRMIGPRLFAAGSVLGLIAVLCAWIGVNLLGVGLHSYGFTSGLARGLLITSAVEIIFVLVTVPLAKKKPG